jgi:pyruvate-ferredoxin/flavodoxin oxidoreductase
MATPMVDKRAWVTLDGNEAVARVAYKLSDVIAIYPITPSSTMGEWADEWAAQGAPNLWSTVPTVAELQSEGGAAGALHGALQAGALATTFTASQGLLLMIPNMYKIAGELTPTVVHVAARSLATQALSIFGDHGDVMAARATGFAMLSSASVQEAGDLAAIAHAATLESRVPFLHFFDGFRTSHEVAKVEALGDDVLRAMVDERTVLAHRGRALSPEHPVVRGTAQNADVAFQAREAANPYYFRCPTVVQGVMWRFARLTGRTYNLIDYAGVPDAERVVILMGSGAETAEQAAELLNARGARVGVLKVRLFRPFPAAALLAALPATTRAVAVLDRTKEPGSAGEPLYLDVVAALSEAVAAGDLPAMPRVIGGRYGLASKEFTPAMVKAVFDELAAPRPRNHFTVGIDDDVTFTSLDWDPDFSTEAPDTVRAVFYGLGADGTVGANKNSIKIIGEETAGHAQGYFVYDSKKSGSVTVSHLRFGPRPIRAPYLITRATFVACHQFSFLERFDILTAAEPNAVFLLNSPHGPGEVWPRLPRAVQEQLIAKRLRFFVIDASRVAGEAGMPGRVNTIMQTCFFAISGVLPCAQAVAAIKHAIEKTYGRRGELMVRRNLVAVDAALAQLSEVKVPDEATSTVEMRRAQPAGAPAFVRDVTARMIAGEGDRLPVSALPADGTYPSGTTRWEKRNIALEIPVWDEALCIQCAKCVLVCPHAAIRAKVYAPAALAGAPAGFKSAPARWRALGEARYTLQVSPEDCTGCGLCVEICPAKSKSEAEHRAIEMVAARPLHDAEVVNWELFLTLPTPDRATLNPGLVKDLQLREPLFEFSGACAGCGETPYLKAVSQLFGDRALIANATGCSSIYGGNQPTTPWTTDAVGRGPAWANSLFEDNAEFGLGMRLALDRQAAYARELFARLGRPRLAAAPGGPVDRGRHRGATRAGRGAQAPVGGDRLPARARARQCRRRPREEECVDHRRRRLGVRHRLWRPRPRPRLGPERERARPRHRGVLEHRRPGVEVDAARRRGEIRRGRQDGREERPCADGDDVRPRVRRARGHGRQRRPHPARPPRGGGLRRSLARHRVQSLHRARLRSAPRSRSAQGGRAVGALAAVPLRSTSGERGEEPAAARFQAAERAAEELRVQRGALRDADPQRRRRREATARARPEGRGRALALLRVSGRHARHPGESCG